MKLWQCSICGEVSPWRDGWGVFSSPAVDDEFPDCRIVVCSDACGKAVDGRLKSGAIKLPKITHRGFLSRMTRDPVGYARQPSQEELLRIWNRGQRREEGLGSGGGTTKRAKGREGVGSGVRSRQAGNPPGEEVNKK